MTIALDHLEPIEVAQLKHCRPDIFEKADEEEEEEKEEEDASDR